MIFCMQNTFLPLNALPVLYLGYISQCNCCAQGGPGSTPMFFLVGKRPKGSLYLMHLMFLKICRPRQPLTAAKMPFLSSLSNTHLYFRVWPSFIGIPLGVCPGTPLTPPTTPIPLDRFLGHRVSLSWPFILSCSWPAQR